MGCVLSLVLAYALVLAAVAPSRPGFLLCLTAMALILFGFGRSVLWVLLGPAQLKPDTLLLALPAGLIVLAGLAQLGNNLGLTATRWLLPLAAAAAIPGCAGAWATVRGHLRDSVRNGWLYLGVIAAIWMLYYLPGSQLDIVPTQDGGTKWWYADSFFHQAMVQELTNSLTRNEFPPPTPGFCRLPLCYQYGNHAVGRKWPTG